MQRQPFLGFTSALVLALLTQACAPVTDHPSLAPRAIERFSVDEEPVAAAPTAAPIAANASQEQRIQALVAKARESDASFQERLRQSRTAVDQGAGASIGSEAWVQAQQELTRAETARTGVTDSLADIEAVQLAAAQAGSGPGESAMIESARSDISAMDASEQAEIDALRNRMLSP